MSERQWQMEFLANLVRVLSSYRWRRRALIASMMAIIILSADAELLADLMILPVYCHDRDRREKRCAI